MCNALYGLQGLSADPPPVRRLVRALAQELRAATPPPAPAPAAPAAETHGPSPSPSLCDAPVGAYLDARNIGNALYGLQVRPYLPLDSPLDSSSSNHRQRLIS